MHRGTANPFGNSLPPRYRVDGTLSQGERATTLDVFDTGLRQARAVLKVQKLSDDEAAPQVEGFRHYCTRLAAVHHDHLAVPYTFGAFSQERGSTFGYTTRQYVSGTPLSGFLLPLPDESVVVVALQLCHGLDALHAAGFVHCDLKPENVIVRRATSGRIDDLSQCVLIDFGYRLESTARALTEVTLQYVAPELLEGNAPDVRSDLYAVGVMLYRLLTGSFPFVAESLPDVMRKQRARECPTIASLRPRAPPGLCNVVERLLEPNPANRPETAQALMALIAEFADSMAVPVRAALKHGAFVGREAELGDCMVALDMDRPSVGVSSIEVCGAPGVGVTSFLRELQDRLEARGATVLTAAPRAACGSTLQSQLREPVHSTARRPAPSAGAEQPLGLSTTSTDLLDDIMVAAQERRLVLFVDDWRLCDAGEKLFVQRLILQDKALIEGTAGRWGRCQVVLGDSLGSTVHAASDLEQAVARRVLLEGLDVDGTAQMLVGDGTLGGLHADRVHTTTGGNPKLIRAILMRVSEAPERPDAELEAALAAAASVVGSEKEEEIAALRKSPPGRGLLALALWGEELALVRWHAIAKSVGTGAADATHAQFIERSGQTFIRSRHRHLTEFLARHLSDAECASIGNAVLAATWEDWWSHDPEHLHRLIRFVARLGRLPSRCRWRVCRALIVLLEQGRFADVESATAALGRCDHAPWWVTLFRDAAQAGSAGDQRTISQAADVDPSGPIGFFSSWIRARSLLRVRYRQEAFKIFDALSVSPLPRARAFVVALAEDHALAAAEAGSTDKVVLLRKSILARIRRWLPFVRRRRKERNAVSMRIRLRAFRKVARYQRVRCRAHLMKGRPNRALSACRKERLFNRADGNLLREAACLNNEGLLLMRRNVPEASAAVLERCVRLREKLDDEQGLVIALTNLAATLSVTGDLREVVAVLNRARIVATRNGLNRLRNFCMVNLAVAYNRRGQLRDAQRILRQVRRLGIGEGDADAKLRALFNGGLVSIDRWNVVAGEVCATQLDRVVGVAADSARDVSGDFLRAEMAYRSRDWAHIHTLVARMRSKGLAGPRTAAYEERVAVEAGESASRRALSIEHGWPSRVRLRVVLLRRKGRRITLESLGRIVAIARGQGAVREAAEWIAAHFERSAGRSDVSLDFGLKTLSWVEFREGQDDLQIELRAQLAAMLRDRGRHAEAWRLIEETLIRFRRLERKLRRWPRGAQVLLHLQERLQVALTGSVGARLSRGQDLSAALCVQAFDVLLDNRRRSVGADDRHMAAVLRLGTALARGGGRAAFVDEVLSVAIGATGAQRAILIRGTPEAQSVERVVLASGARSDACASDISWAVVSQVVTSGASSVFGDALTSEELASHRSIAVLKLRSLACVPLHAGDRVLGALYLDHHGIAGLISHEMLGFLELLAGVIALTLHMDNVEGRTGAVRRELDAAHRHILRAERSRLAGELAGGLVHDLKNVLAAVSGRSQLLRRTNHDPQVLRSLDAIEKAAGAGAGLLQRLQECARDHSSQVEEPVDLVAIAREALELLGPRLEKGQVTTEMRCETDGVVWGVPGEYRELFLNLFVNACDAMPDGGKLTVAFASSRRDASIEVAVVDTGVGMSAETRARLFEPFYTTKGNNGTGLGLVVVRSVVVRRGGLISVESALGCGSRFILTLPRLSK